MATPTSSAAGASATAAAAGADPIVDSLPPGGASTSVVVPERVRKARDRVTQITDSLAALQPVLDQLKAMQPTQGGMDDRSWSGWRANGGDQQREGMLQAFEVVKKSLENEAAGLDVILRTFNEANAAATDAAQGLLSRLR